MLIDSSAWIEYLRRTGSAHNDAVRLALSSEQAHVTDVVRMEVLAGAFRGANADKVTTLLDAATEVEQIPRDDIEAAAAIYRRCRVQGDTIRSLNDCLLAAIAIRASLSILHRDRDFEVIARHTDLRLVAP